MHLPRIIFGTLGVLQEVAEKYGDYALDLPVEIDFFLPPLPQHRNELPRQICAVTWDGGSHAYRLTLLSQQDYVRVENVVISGLNSSVLLCKGCFVQVRHKQYAVSHF